MAARVSKKKRCWPEIEVAGAPTVCALGLGKQRADQDHGGGGTHNKVSHISFLK